MKGLCNWKKPSDRKQVLHSPVDFLEREYLWSWQWKWPCSICSGWAKVSYHLYNPSSTQKHWLPEKSALTTVVTCVSPINNVIVQIFRLFLLLENVAYVDNSWLQFSYPFLSCLVCDSLMPFIISAYKSSWDYHTLFLRLRPLQTADSRLIKNVTCLAHTLTRCKLIKQELGECKIC